MIETITNANQPPAVAIVPPKKQKPIVLRSFGAISAPTAAQRKPGRPKRYASAAHKQQAYRNRLAAEARIERIKPSASDCSDNRGMFMKGAPHGKGKLITGGYGSTDIESVTAQHDAAEIARQGGPASIINGKRATGESHGDVPDANNYYDGGLRDSNRREEDNTFQNDVRHPWSRAWLESTDPSPYDREEKQQALRKGVWNFIGMLDPPKVNPDWNPVTKTFRREAIPYCCFCMVCEELFEWPVDALEHIIGKHRPTLWQAVRDPRIMPRNWRKPKKSKRRKKAIADWFEWPYVPRAGFSNVT